ncbi:MAG: hypothetical protein JXA57_10260 [Armatimonadetes bacterium]|nr:hypothetical protein [Armatimonadota bacterium]
MTASPLIRSKVGLPRVAGDIVLRPRLLDRLEQGVLAANSLFLVSAPAGAGKTTLLASWLKRRPEAVAWLSLDKSDNDPARFMRYLVTAFQRVDAKLGGWLGPALSSLEPAPLELLLSRLLEDLTDIGKDVFLVLDDYHVVSSPEVKRAMAFLLERLPENVRLFVTTRADPQLPLARLRAQGLLTEIRERDLRLTFGEAGEYLNTHESLDLPDDEVRQLVERTEGWVVGVRLAALALKGGGEERQTKAARSAFVSQFSGRHHFILDYLVEEVLSHVTEAERSFFLHTAVLDRFSASLADVLSSLGGWDESESLLMGLVRQNMFLVPLDEERVWYRYHHLFADLLRARLSAERPGSEAEVHRRAAVWFERQASSDEAIGHAIAGADWDLAGELLGRHVQGFLDRGEMLTVLAWIDRLPRDVVAHRPQIAMSLAWALTFANRIGEAEQLVSLVEQAVVEQGAGLADVEREVLMLNATVARAYYSLVAARPRVTVALLNEAEKLLSPDRLKERCIAEWLRGYAYRSLGEMEDCVAHARRAVELADNAGSLWGMLTLTDLAVSHFWRGELTSALEQYQRALLLGDSQGQAAHGYLGRVETGLALVYLARNELEEAIVHARLAVDWSQRWRSANHLVQALTVLGRVHVARTEWRDARESLEEAERQRRGAFLLPQIPTQLEGAWVDYWLAVGHLARAQVWAGQVEKETELLREGEFSDAEFVRLLALARVRVASLAGKEPGSRDDASRHVWDSLERLSELASRTGWKHHLVEIMALRALAARRLDRTDTLEIAERALLLARSGGYVRPFVDLGGEMEHLLYELRRRTPGCMPQYLDMVLAGFSSPGRSSRSSHLEETSLEQAVLEPLTSRETEVLRLLEQGLSNRQLAARLFLSEGTVKTHTHRLYRKLGVGSRTAALARARELHLL